MNQSNNEKKEKPGVFDVNSSIFQYSPGITELAGKLFEVNHEIMTLEGRRAALEKELLEFRGASTSDAYLKATLLFTMLRRDLGYDPAHPIMRIANSITSSLDAVHIKLNPANLPEEVEGH